MAGINKVILVGNLGKDPEVRYLEGGTAVANFTLAASETFKDKNTGERKTSTEWHNIVVWRGLAEITEKYLKKGMQVYIEGKLRTRQWQDKEGNNRYTTEVVSYNFQLLGICDEVVSMDKSEHIFSSEPAVGNIMPTPSPEIHSPAEDVDDLPF